MREPLKNVTSRHCNQSLDKDDSDLLCMHDFDKKFHPPTELAAV